MLELTDGLPERHLAMGEVLFAEGAAEHTVVAVLVAGRLQVEIEGHRIPDVALAGSFVGEVGALLAIPRTATVTAAEPSTVRVVGDPQAFFGSHPAVALELARQLAGRLHRLTSYLGDVRAQYSDAGGHLAMVDSILARLASRPPVTIDPGSDRAPDY